MNWSFFDKVVLINLDSRPDRLGSVSEELKRVGLSDYQRLSATELTPGWKGFNASYRRALQEIAGCEVGLILEDDVRFEKGLDSMGSALQQLPEDWHALWFGANVKARSPRVSANLNRLLGGWTTHAVAYKGHFAQVLLDAFDWEGNRVFDDFLRTDIQPYYNCFITNPLAAVQAPDYSNLMNKDVDYRELFEYSQECMLR